MHTYDERIIPDRDCFQSHTFYSEHLARYAFADRFIPRSGIVLDLCCGCGYGSAYLAESSDRTIVGLDLSPESIAYARRQYRGCGLTYLRADVMQLPAREDTVDAVIAMEALEHLRDPRTVVRQVARILKPGGVFLASTPNRLVTKSGEVPPNPFHVREYTPEEFVDLIGTEFPQVALYGEALSPAFLVYERSLQRLWRGLWLMRGLYHEQKEALANLERTVGLTWLRTLKRKVFGGGSRAAKDLPDKPEANDQNWERDLREEFERAEGAVASLADWQITPYGIEKAPILIAVCRKDEQ